MKRSATSQRPHVVTFQRRDVGSTDTEVNNQKRRNVSTSRRLNVAESQRRGVSTSRRLNVAASQCRDVETSRRQHEICTSSFKAPMVQNLRVSGGVRKRARNSRAGVTPTSKKCPLFVLFPIFGYWNDVFEIKHFHFLIQYVLDLYLGFH